RLVDIGPCLRGGDREEPQTHVPLLASLKSSRVKQPGPSAALAICAGNSPLSRKIFMMKADVPLISASARPSSAAFAVEGCILRNVLPDAVALSLHRRGGGPSAASISSISFRRSALTSSLSDMPRAAARALRKDRTSASR